MRMTANDTPMSIGEVFREMLQARPIVVTLPGSIRSKKNSKRVFKSGPVTRVLPSSAYLKWEEAARAAIMQQLFPDQCHKATGPLHVKVIAYYKGQQPDLSGVLESVGDCLEGFLWDNDRQIQSWDGSRLVHDLDNPRTVVEVVPLEAASKNQTNQEVAA